MGPGWGVLKEGGAGRTGGWDSEGAGSRRSGVEGRGGALEYRDLTPVAGGIPGRRLALPDRCCPLAVWLGFPAPASWTPVHRRGGGVCCDSVERDPKGGKVPVAVGMG